MFVHSQLLLLATDVFSARGKVRDVKRKPFDIFMTKNFKLNLSHMCFWELKNASRLTTRETDANTADLTRQWLKHQRLIQLRELKKVPEKADGGGSKERVGNLEKVQAWAHECEHKLLIIINNSKNL